MSFSEISSLFLDDSGSIPELLIKGVIGYFGLIVLLRVSGNRTLSKFNMFDLVITVAFGSALASLILSKDVSIAEGLTALALLIFLQFVITWSSVRVSTIRRAVKGDPILLYYDGGFCADAMRKARVPEAEIYAAMREEGLGSLSQVQAAVLETNGTLSIIEASEVQTHEALAEAGMPRFERRA